MLPEGISIDADHGILELPFYQGEMFNDKWNERTGGSLLGLDLSTEIPLLIRELASLDTTIITENECLKNLALVFSRATYFSALAQNLGNLFGRIGQRIDRVTSPLGNIIGTEPDGWTHIC